MKEKYPRWMYFVLPGIAMMLGWGLRGYIGGGPFGAMIPGAMLAFSICLLLELPAAATSIIVVFGVWGIGLGGEMTYGQTLGVLREPGTFWWGTTGTTLKGAIWGLLGGTVFSIGFFFKRISRKNILTGFLLMLLGFFLGFKLINDPMLIYFSDPENPRSESWAALLFGAVALLVYFRFILQKNDFRIISRFAVWGTIGGGLGFGLGALWLYLGSRIDGVIFTSWWKAMEFTFGLLLGVFLGYSAWLSRKDLKRIIGDQWSKSDISFYPVYKELGLTFLLGLATYLIIPGSLEPFVDAASSSDGFVLNVLRSIARILVNYAFYGFVFLLMLFRFPKIAWQIGITLTFCHTAIDLIRDIYPDETIGSFLIQFILVAVMTAVVGLLTVWLSSCNNKVFNLFLLLIWSTVLVAFLRLGLTPEVFRLAGLSVCEIICGRFFVHLVFIFSAAFISWFLVKEKGKMEQNKESLAAG